MREETAIEPAPAEADPSVPRVPVNDEEPSLSRLFRRLSDDARTLVQQEIALAKSEVQKSATALAKGAVLVGLGAATLLVGLLVLTAFVVVGLGALLGGEYWLSALIVGGLLALIGAILLLIGRGGLRDARLAPEQSKQSLREDKEWARAEIQEIKHDLATRTGGKDGAYRG